MRSADCAFLQVLQIKFIFLIFSCFSTTGCQTAPTKFEVIEKGKWNARISFKDLRGKAKSQTVSSVILSERPNKLRMEVVSSLGQHMATVTMNGERLQILNVTEKLYSSGSATKETFDKSLGILLDPHVFVDVLFDQEPKGFSCQRNDKEFLSLCENRAEKSKIEWLERDASRKTIVLTSQAFAIQLQLQGFSTEVQVSDETFNIIPPKSFKRNSF